MPDNNRFQRINEIILNPKEISKSPEPHHDHNEHNNHKGLNSQLLPEYLHVQLSRYNFRIG